MELKQLYDEYWKVKDLIGAGLNTIYLCLDGATKQTYEEIRRRADYEQTSDNIRSFCREWAWWQPTPFKSWGNAPSEEPTGTERG